MMCGVEGPVYFSAPHASEYVQTATAILVGHCPLVIDVSSLYNVSKSVDIPPEDGLVDSYRPAVLPLLGLQVRRAHGSITEH